MPVLWRVGAATVAAVLAAGCASPVGDPPAGMVLGDCGGVYHHDLPKQILLDVVFSEDVLAVESPDITDVEIAAETDGKQYAATHVGPDGCARLPLRDEGPYTFWAFGFRDDGACWYQGYVRGIYQGQPVVEAGIVLDRHCP